MRPLATVWTFSSMPISLDQPLARLRERYDRSVIPRFLAWWWEELLGCLPARWRRELAQQPPVLRVARHGGGWLLERRRGAQVEAVEELAPDSDDMLKRAAVARLREAVAAERQKAEHVETLKRQVQEAVVAANFLADRKCVQAATIEVVNELTNLLPDHTWLERMTFFGRQVQLQGQSQQANALIALLGQAKTIRDPQFQGVIQPDMTSGKERFSLQANLVIKEACE